MRGVRGLSRAQQSRKCWISPIPRRGRFIRLHNTLGVITVSGGAGVLISDVAESLGLPMPEMPLAAQQKLRALVPFCAPRNPVDATAQVSNDMTLVKTFTNRWCETADMLGAGFLQHDRVVAPLAGDPRTVERGA